VKKVLAADLFCGAGGTSTGLRQACHTMGLKLDLIAINHWPIAVETHSRNHPDVRHVCAAIESVEPRSVVPGGHLDLLLASPECTHHSSARGGKPMSDQKRASAHLILRWAESLAIDAILIENVPEFRSWGPLGANLRPLKRKRGALYQHFIEGLRVLGYTVEDRILNAADYGAATTRKRLFILARKGRTPITWPALTHSPTGGRTLFGRTEKWKPAREIIDWSLQGQSIFTRKRPLKPATMRRILAGLEKFGGPELKPFLVILRNHADGRSVERPLPALCAAGQHVGVAEPFLMHLTHAGADDRSRSIDDPVPTITTANRGELGLVEPFVLQQQSGGVPRAVSDPVPTIAAKGAISLIEPVLVEYHSEKKNGGGPRARSVDQPLPTQDTSNRFGLAQPFIVPFLGERDGQQPRVKSVDDPLQTITTQNPIGLAEPIITSYYGTQNVSPLSAPLPTVTTKDRFGLVMPVIDGKVLDIRFRMLKLHELAAAMDFPADYQFAGNQGEGVRQVGNAVDVLQAQVLCRELLLPLAARSKKARRLEAIA